MSFTEGFRTGFGLMSNVKDQQLRERRLEEDMKYRSETDAATADYRARDLDIKEKAQDSAEKLNTYKAETNRITAGNQKTAAETALINAQIAADKQAALSDPTSPEYKLNESNISKNKATTDSIRTDQEVAQSNLDRFQAAQRFNDVYEMTNPEHRYSNDDLIKIEEFYQANRGAGTFNFETAMTDVTMQGTQEIAAYMHDSANGLNPEMSDSLLRAYTSMLELDKSSAYGRHVDNSFVNAPIGWRNKGYSVSEHGLIDATYSGGEDLKGLLAVEIVNERDPSDVQFYVAPVTESRSYIDGKPLNINVGKVNQAVAANTYMLQNVAAKMKPAVKQARILAKFGNNKGDNGNKAFNEQVESIVQSNLDAITGGGNTLGLMGMTAAFGEDGRPTTMTKEETDKMRRNIEEQLLFGVRPEPMQTRFHKWLKETRAALNDAPTPDGKSTLKELIPEEQWSPQLVSALAPYYDRDDQGELKTDTKGLAAELRRKGFL